MVLPGTPAKVHDAHTASERLFRGLRLFSYGFRPFFFFGAVYAGAIILVWLPAFYGQL